MALLDRLVACEEGNYDAPFDGVLRRSLERKQAKPVEKVEADNART